MATVTRESVQQMSELVDEAKQWLQHAGKASDEKTRQKQLEAAENALARIEALVAGKEP